MRYILLLLLLSGCATVKSVDKVNERVDSLGQKVRHLDSTQHDLGPVWEMK